MRIVLIYNSICIEIQNIGLSVPDVPNWILIVDDEVLEFMKVILLFVLEISNEDH